MVDEDNYLINCIRRMLFDYEKDRIPKKIKLGIFQKTRLYGEVSDMMLCGIVELGIKCDSFEGIPIEYTLDKSLIAIE